MTAHTLTDEWSTRAECACGWRSAPRRNHRLARLDHAGHLRRVREAGSNAPQRPWKAPQSAEPPSSGLGDERRGSDSAHGGPPGDVGGDAA